MDVASLYVFPVFIVFEIIQILTLKKELSVLKSDKQTFATSSSTERIDLDRGIFHHSAATTGRHTPDRTCAGDCQLDAFHSDR